MIELRSAVYVWDVQLPPLSDYEDPVWGTSLAQEQTPYGLGWVDGSARPQKAHLKLWSYVSAVDARTNQARAEALLAALAQATAVRDSALGGRYWVTQGVLGEVATTVYRGKTTRLITVTLALRDPYLHDSDDLPAGGVVVPPAPGNGTPPPPDTGYY